MKTWIPPALGPDQYSAGCIWVYDQSDKEPHEKGRADWPHTGSWLKAMRSLLLRMARSDEEMVRKSLPMNKGDLRAAQRAKCVRDSALVSGPLPTSSI